MLLTLHFSTVPIIMNKCNFYTKERPSIDSSPQDSNIFKINVEIE